MSLKMFNSYIGNIKDLKKKKKNWGGWPPIVPHFHPYLCTQVTNKLHWITGESKWIVLDNNFIFLKRILFVYFQKNNCNIKEGEKRRRYVF